MRAEGGALVACGGDGTINAVAAAALAEDVPLGILPQGTFNFFGRTHGISSDIDAAVALKPEDESYRGELENYRATAADEAAMKAGELLENGDGPGAMSYFKRAYVLSPASIVPGFLSNENGTYYLNEDGTFRTGWYDYQQN